MSSPAVPAEEPYTGPVTGQFDAATELLSRMADLRAARARTLPLPVYAGPVTGQQAVLREVSLIPQVPAVPTKRTAGTRTAVLWAAAWLAAAALGLVPLAGGAPKVAAAYWGVSGLGLAYAWAAVPGLRRGRSAGSNAESAGLNAE